MKKVCVIGAGPSGLCAINHCIKEGFEVIAFEQSDEVGGVWNYTGAVGVNKYGIETHSSIYDNMLTNGQKEAMEFPNFSYDENEKDFYLTTDKVQNYFTSYADAFELRKHIKFEHQVINVHPKLITDEWEVIVRDLPSGSLEIYRFDFIFMCIGISVPSTPKIKGHELFEGNVMHSHDYRNPEPFKNERVLLIGSGPTAIDVVKQLGEVAERVFWVQKIKEIFGVESNMKIPENAEKKVGEYFKLNFKFNKIK
jgi:dimethylaniline monooxygenase (N-oxide forming)